MLSSSSSSWCLLFKEPPASTSSTGPAVVVELLHKEDVDLRYALPIANVFGCLGVVRMGGGESAEPGLTTAECCRS